MRDFNLHSVTRVDWKGFSYPVVSVAGKDSLWVHVSRDTPIPHQATEGRVKGIVLIKAKGLVLHRKGQPNA